MFLCPRRNHLAVKFINYRKVKVESKGRKTLCFPANNRGGMKMAAIPEHQHIYRGITLNIDNHCHIYGGKTEDMVYYPGNHGHSLRGETGQANDHRHAFHCITGPAVEGQGGHYHYFQCYTSPVEGHKHQYQGSTVACFENQ
jgi:hypothetical protein